MSIYTKAINIVPNAVGRVPLEQSVGNWSFGKLTMGLLVQVSNFASSSSSIVVVFYSKDHLGLRSPPPHVPRLCGHASGERPPS